MNEAGGRLRFQQQAFGWEGVEPRAYKEQAAGEGGLGWRGVTRHTLFGRDGEPAAFEVRYFEIEPHGYSTLEQHEHVHAVTIVRGRGKVLVGDRVYDAEPMDFFYIPPRTAHQFVNDGEEPFGFLCVVDRERDRPQPLDAETLARLRQNPATAAVLRL